VFSVEGPPGLVTSAGRMTRHKLAFPGNLTSERRRHAELRGCLLGCKTSAGWSFATKRQSWMFSEYGTARHAERAPSLTAQMKTLAEKGHRPRI
jgi:hypothetical protein